jgi:hypothetical protein
LPLDIDSIIAQVRPLSMCPNADLRFTIEQALAAVDRDLPGVIVECGVWRGGAAAATLLGQLQQYGAVRRPAILLDSFEGLPPAQERDGPLALAYQANDGTLTYLDNCRAGVDEVRAGLAALALPATSYELVPGWFEETVPALAQRLSGMGIAFLRLDGDWYDSTMVCLEHLVPLVAEEGVIIIDDYYAWDGCARAVHDYLSRHDLAYRIRAIPGGDAVGGYVIKRAARTDPSRL